MTDILVCFLLLLSLGSAFRVQVKAVLGKCKSSDPRSLRTCPRKIRFEMEMENGAESPTEQEFLMVDSVYDPLDRINKRLVNAVAFQFRQERRLITYPFHYLSGVNGKIEEIILNKDTFKNYTGCNINSFTQYTCGIKQHLGKIIPFSQGFCCFCERNFGRQTRGGQDCSENVRTEALLSSTHCLHFNRIWYVVTSFGEPAVQHSIYIQVYIRRETFRGSTVWWKIADRELTVGSHAPYLMLKETLVVKYLPAVIPDDLITIDVDKHRLLIPSPDPLLTNQMHPAILNGASDYLIVPKTMVDSSGRSCNKIGVSYEAFYKQENKCEKPRGSCLKNQPLDLWSKDQTRRQKGLKGDYFLQFYGKPSEEPILYNKTTKEHWLAMDLPDNTSSNFYLELNAINISILSPGKFAHITNIVTKSLGKIFSALVFVTNTGLVGTDFSIQIVRCPYGILKSELKIITVPPQSMRNITLQVFRGSLSTQVDEISCQVEISSISLSEMIAVRKVLFKINQHCLCYYYCRCACTENHYTCQSMSELEYHLSGFRHSLPVVTSKTKSYSGYWLEITLIFLIIFLILGLAKEIMNEANWHKIGQFGLKNFLYRKKRLNCYYEPELREARVIYENEYPINPDTKEHARTISYRSEAMVNILFFFVWPFLLLHTIYLKCCCSEVTLASEISFSASTYTEEKYYLHRRYSESDNLAKTYTMQSYISAKSEVDRMLNELITKESPN